MGCKDTVICTPLLKNYNANCLIFNRNTIQPKNRIFCWFGALALHLRSNDELEQEIVFLAKNDKRDASKSQGSQLNDIALNWRHFAAQYFFY